MVLTAALLALGLACASAEAQNTRTAGADQKMVTLTGLLRGDVPSVVETRRRPSCDYAT
jgi:hypothetical protein